MKANRKKKVITMLSIALTAVLIIGGTLAYLASVTEEKDNVFTFAENIKARLDEPNWDPNDATNLTPGYEVNKDPMITNLSENGVDEFVAVKLTFTNGTGVKLTAAETVRLLNCLDITWNANWSLESGTLTTDATGTVTAATEEQMYVYKGTLAPGQVSDPVFSSVTIKSDISDADFAWLAAIVTDHTDACYTYSGVHDPLKCTLTYKHHANCVLHSGTGTAAQIAATAKGGTVGGKICNCSPADQHLANDPEDPCPATKGTLIASCGHTVPAGAISGFMIKVQGAVVQAGVDSMDNWNDSATVTNLKGLLGL